MRPHLPPHLTREFAAALADLYAAVVEEGLRAVEVEEMWDESEREASE